ncbi:unnamed protein product [Lota lota]
MNTLVFDRSCGTLSPAGPQIGPWVARGRLEAGDRFTSTGYKLWVPHTEAPGLARLSHRLPPDWFLCAPSWFLGWALPPGSLAGPSLLVPWLGPPSCFLYGGNHIHSFQMEPSHRPRGSGKTLCSC